MAENSNIEWTDATVNFWWGCTKVGPGCDHCYAEKWDNRVGGAHWGLNVPRRKIESAGKTLHRLNRKHQRVFIQSMSDLFDLEVPLEWFAEAWGKIEKCNRLEIQIVTKRVSAVEKRLAQIGCTTWPKHAGLIITVVNQVEADRDIPRLLALKAKFGIPWIGLSIEPMLGPIDLMEVIPNPIIYSPVHGMDRLLDWVICGGESGKNARPMHPDWPRAIRNQCKAAGVPFLFKQWGEWQHGSTLGKEPKIDAAVLNDGTLIWPATHQKVIDADREIPVPSRRPEMIARVGKKRAGRLLDGIEHNGYPRT